MRTGTVSYLDAWSMPAVVLVWVAPISISQAQSSPFMTGATALQTNRRTADIATALAVIGADAQPLLAGPGWASVTAPRKAKRVDHLRAALGHFEA